MSEGWMENINIKEDKDGNMSWDAPMPEMVWLEVNEKERREAVAEIMSHLN
jgi:hypothetical protein